MVGKAPDLTAALLETADALYPDCADTLMAALRGLETNHTVAALNTSSPNDSTPDGNANGGGTDGDGGGGLDGSSPFGGGLGPGFPGAPGFSGSAPSAGVALPTPVPPAASASENAPPDWRAKLSTSERPRPVPAPKGLVL